MNKKTKIIVAAGIGLVAMATVGIAAVTVAKRVSFDGSTISVAGGKDGPASVFFAGKLSGNEHDQPGISYASEAEYESISMEEAKTLFSEKSDFIILDVRRADEFKEGHIPGAINVANEEIGNTEPEELPDKDAEIYVYCRSGRRSKEAAAKLAALGYTRIIECGGILDWTGEIEK